MATRNTGGHGGCFVTAGPSRAARASSPPATSAAQQRKAHHKQKGAEVSG